MIDIVTRLREAMPPNRDAGQWLSRVEQERIDAIQTIETLRAHLRRAQLDKLLPPAPEVISDLDRVRKIFFDRETVLKSKLHAQDTTIAMLRVQITDLVRGRVKT